MMQCICLLALVAVAGVVNGRSLRVASGYAAAPPHHLLPNPYYPQPYSYPAPSPYGYGYQTRPLIYSPPGSYFDSVYGLRKPLPGGGNPVAVDYVGSHAVLTLLSPISSWVSLFYSRTIAAPGTMWASNHIRISSNITTFVGPTV